MPSAGQGAIGQMGRFEFCVRGSIFNSVNCGEYPHMQAPQAHQPGSMPSGGHVRSEGNMLFDEDDKDDEDGGE